MICSLFFIFRENFGIVKVTRLKIVNSENILFKNNLSKSKITLSLKDIGEEMVYELDMLCAKILF